MVKSYKIRALRGACASRSPEKQRLLSPLTSDCLSLARAAPFLRILTEARVET